MPADALAAALQPSAPSDHVLQLIRTLVAFDTVSRNSNLGLFSRAGIPTVVCGPGNIEQAHKPNEYIALPQIAQCEAFMRRLAQRQLQPA